MLKRIFVLILFSINLYCTKNLTFSKTIFISNFENEKPSNLTINNIYGQLKDSKIFYFNRSKVIGPLNNNSINVYIDSLPDHNILEINFDLYIHDNWQGNKINSNGMPDLFAIKVNDEPKFFTTFSNDASYNQSFPEWFPNGQNPIKSNSLDIALPGLCYSRNNKNGTTMYSIKKSFPNTDKSVVVSISDALQPYNSSCEKSWSIDNIKIVAFRYF
jgi:hypothetical protein